MYPPVATALICPRLLPIRSIFQRDHTVHQALDSWDVKQISKEIDCAERQDRPETAKHSNKVGDNDTERASRRR